MKKILSCLLVAVMLFGAVVGLIPEATVHAYAAGEPAETLDEALSNATSISYASLQDKLAKDKSMQLLLSLKAKNNNVYQLYANAYTGEVIYYNDTTQEGVSTNPYDAGANKTISPTVKEQLMSQVIVSYKGTDGSLKTMYSYAEAAKRGQIIVKAIKNGIRVQYTIGRENATYLMPTWITTDRYQEEILDPIAAKKAELEEIYAGYDTSSEEYLAYRELIFRLDKIGKAYILKDPNTANERERKLMQKQYPITAEKVPGSDKYYAIWVVDESLMAVDAVKAGYEDLIRTYCPDYTYEDLAADNALTGYVSKQEAPPLFKIALEYSINKEDGSLDIRMPANSILYDESLFQLENIVSLPYFGAGYMSTSTYETYLADVNHVNKNTNTVATYSGECDEDAIVHDGYVFYPDGSGAIFEFSKLYTTTNSPAVLWNSKVYGQDYAYHTVTGKNQETIRLPVYGVVSTDVTIVEGEGSNADIVTKKHGFVAILEEGEAMTSLEVAFGGARYNYASVYPVYTPRPKDTYDLAESISVSGDTEWTVVADRKYTGSYRTRVILLSEHPDAEYAPSWVDMAAAYRDLLEAKGVLNRKTADMVKEKIPLYIEAFGAYETKKQILSMPVDVKVPLTSFEDIGTMYDDLAENAGISNIYFKLTGFANGGMYANYPAKLKWEKAVGGAGGFKDLIAKAESEDFGVYPEFDFTYVSNEGSFDGVSLKKIGARSVDNRYCSKQVYDAVYQQYTSYFDMCVSTDKIAAYFEKFSKKLSSYEDEGTYGLSVGTLGSELNSNFDEDNPVNREQAKEDIKNLLASMKASYQSLMLNSGNAYTFAYADHVIGLPLSGSNYRHASASVPFMAMVLHGYVNYTGSAINMSGDTDYNTLKAIENGAYPYFMLSYNTSNTMLLKKDDLLNKYYSVRYDIWRWTDTEEKTGNGSLVTKYNEINAALHDLQNAVMVNHEFVRGERVLKDKEITENKALLKKAILDGVKNKIDNAAQPLFALLAGNLDLYNRIVSHDDAIKAKVAAAPNIAFKRNEVSNYLRDNGMADIRADSAMLARVQSAYVNGNGAEDLRILRGLRMVTNGDVNAIWTSIVDDVNVVNAFTAEELAAIRLEVEALVAANTQNAASPLFAQLAALLGTMPTGDDVAFFNELIYTGMEKAAVEAAATDGFSVALDATKAAALADKVVETRTAKQVLVAVTEVEIDFDFNVTDSEATDGNLYDKTDYTLADERIVLVTYKKADGTYVRILLNYNIFGVKVKIGNETHTLDSYGWKRIDS